MLKRASAAYVVIAAIACCAWVSTAQADLFEEVHDYHQEVQNMAYDSSVTLTLDIDRFETYGGARDLLGVRCKYSLHNVFTITVNDNMSAEMVGCEVMWWVGWTGTFPNGSVLPIDPGMGGTMGGGFGFGVVRAPLQPGEVLTNGGGTGWTDPVTVDPAYLVPLTGTGTLTIGSEFWVGELNYFPPMFWPGDPGVFDPTIADYAIDEFSLDMTITYIYTPEPTSACLFFVGGMLCLIRRPRHCAAK